MAAAAAAAAAAAEEEDARPRSLPSYSQMILKAISALNDKNETSRASISRYIESAYGEQLPASHDSLLAAHLSRMTEIGELVLVNNCYFHDGPDLPSPKRGRGRPPKPKFPDQVLGSSGITTSVDATAGQKRPRGRPPKPVDPSAPAKVPRPRGRPPKNPRTDGTSPDGSSQVRRPRGRPPKVRPEFTEVGFV